MRDILIIALRWARRIDWWLISGISMLLTAGALMQYSFSMSGDAVMAAQYSRHIMYLCIGIVLFIIFSIIDQRIIRIPMYWWIAAAVFSLLLVLLFGKTIQGTKGWFVIAGISLQPVEFVKLCYILFMAHYFEKGLPLMQNAFHAIVSGAVTATLMLFILAQPDLGSAAILFFIWFSVAVLLRAPKWILLSVSVSAVLFGVLGWYVFFDDYQRDRLAVFINPQEYAQGAGYNVIQSMVAVGSGGIWGRGLGFGTQSQLHFLPEVSTDFVFAAFAEEFGFLGVVVLVSSLALIVFRLWVYIRKTRDPYVAILCTLTALYITIQSSMIIGMNLGLLPVTGVPLPLVSAGGSSLLMTLTLLGMVHHQFVSGRTHEL